MSDEENSPLTDILKDNQVVLISDIDHLDGSIRKAVSDQLGQMHVQGLRHLYLEHDPHDVSISELKAQTDEYGELVRKADSLGIQVHFYDDRSRGHELEARHPEEAALANDISPYRLDTDEVMRKAPNIAKMKALFADESAHWIPDGIEYRNQKMIENLSLDMHRHPDEKSLVFSGAQHSKGKNDIDEGLRKNGHQVATVEINSANSAPSYPGADKPDFIIYAENGKIASCKNQETHEMERVLNSADLQLTNNEPVTQNTDNLPTYLNRDEKGKIIYGRDIPDHIRDYLTIKLASEHVNTANALSNQQRDFIKNYLAEKLSNVDKESLIEQEASPELSR